MLTNDDKAILLLCSHVGLKDETLKPLTLKDWNELASAILKSNVKRPGNLFALSEEEMYKELNIPKADIENILKLLSRSLELGVDLDRLYSKGINVVTRASSLYPRKLKKVLKDLAPPVLFYCGNISLLTILFFCFILIAPILQIKFNYKLQYINPFSIAFLSHSMAS